jgi:hypothetical protein
MNGWIKLHRQFLEWEWYDTPEMVHVFIHLLLSANHEAKKWHGVDIDRGSFLTSLPKLSQSLHISQQVLRTCLNRLKSTNEITVKSTNKYSLITICKYDTYQVAENDINKQNNTPPNIPSTDSQHSINSQLTTTKESKKEKKDKKEKKEEDTTVSVDLKIDLLHSKFIEVYCSWYLEKVGVKYKFQGGEDGAAIKSLKTFIKDAIKEKNGVEPDDESILNGWRFILKNWNKWDPFNQKQLKISQISSNMANIMPNIRGINGKQGTSNLASDIAEINAIGQLMREQAGSGTGS